VTRPAVLTRRARAELREALRWIADDSLEAARDLNNAVEAATRRIGANPLIGAHRLVLAGERYRFWSVPRHSYILVYDPAPVPPQILRMLHMARDLGPLLTDLRD